MYLHVYRRKTQSHYHLSTEKECELGLILSLQVHCKQTVVFFSTFVFTMEFLSSFFISSREEFNIGWFTSTEICQSQNYLQKRNTFLSLFDGITREYYTSLYNDSIGICLYHQMRLHSHFATVSSVGCSLNPSICYLRFLSNEEVSMENTGKRLRCYRNNGFLYQRRLHIITL